MKKHILFIAFIALIFSSCDMKEDYEQINSNTMEFAGDWYFKVLEGTTELKIYDRNRLITYNTTADLSDEIWIDDGGKTMLNLKFKSKFTGSLTSFTSPATANINFVANATPSSTPSALGETTVIEQYKEAEVLEGKILLDGATSKAGNTVDALSLSIRAVKNTITFASAASGATFVWAVQSNVDANQDFVIEGHRYTGFIEDNY